MNTEKYAGLIIPNQCVKDIPSKDAIQYKLTGWQRIEVTEAEWFKHLEAGRPIIIGDFISNENGDYTHAEKLWQSTQFILADADHFKNVDFDKDGIDQTPEGADAWTEENKLGDFYPGLKDTLFAVGQSVTSMLSWDDPEKGRRIAHRRFRLAFKFDRPITCGDQYRYVYKQLADTFPLLSPDERQPAQPVFGNACPETNTWHMHGKVLNLDEWLEGYEVPEPVVSPKISSEQQMLDTQHHTTLQEWLDKHSIPYTLANEPNKFFVECPNKGQHTGQTQRPKDSYVFEDGVGKSFYCSHAHCKDKRSWKFFKESHGIACYTDVPKKPSSAQPIPYPQLLKSEVIDDESLIHQDDSDPDDIVFPEALMTGIFGTYKESLEGRIPIPDSFAFASLKQVMSATLGRFISLSEGVPLYPNLYTGLIGESSGGHKGVTINVARSLLKKADPGVFVLNRTTTEEGLIDLFKTPSAFVTEDEDGTKEVTYSGGVTDLVNEEQLTEIMSGLDGDESVRVFGNFAEFSTVLTRSKKATFSGMPELLMELYDMPDSIAVANKQSKTVADFPTFSMIGGSEFGLIEQALGLHLISGGFTNRIEWYIGKEKDPLFLYGSPEKDRWETCIQAVAGLRSAYPSPTSFELTGEAFLRGQKWIEEYTTYLNGIENLLVLNSLKRMKVFVIKNALIFAAIEDRQDHKVHLQDIEKALLLAKYNTQVVHRLFGNFTNSEHERVTKRILEVLTKKPKQSTKQIHNSMKWASLKDIDLALDILLKRQMIGRIKPKRTELYFVVTEDVDPLI